MALEPDGDPVLTVAPEGVDGRRVDLVGRRLAHREDLGDALGGYVLLGDDQPQQAVPFSVAGTRQAKPNSAARPCMAANDSVRNSSRVKPISAHGVHLLAAGAAGEGLLLPPLEQTSDLDRAQGPCPAGRARPRR